MKRILIMLLCCVMLLPCVAVSAATCTVSVADNAGLLTADEEALLESSTVLLESEMRIYILTTDSLQGQSADRYVDGFFQSSAADSVVFLVSMEDGQWHIAAYGTAASLISDRDIEAMGEAVVPSLSAGKYYKAFDTWLQILPEYMQPEPEPAYSASYLVAALLIGAAVGGIAILIMRGSMKTAKQQPSANEYLKQGSFRLNVKQDWFLYSRVSKTPRPKNNSSSGRGGGGRRSGGGRF